jgi:shikimate dehydrogenase
VSFAVTARTRTFALLGNPVAHSWSPLIHNAALRAEELDAVYVALACAETDVPALMHTLAGGNVTIPYKAVAAEALDRGSERVRRTGACNTFWMDGKRLSGDNTDVIGFSVALRRLLPDPAGARVLIVGAGGAARAALYALLQDDVDEVTLIARRRSRYEQIESVAGRRVRRVRLVNKEKAIKGEGFDLIVNATPLGLRERDPAPLNLEKLAGLRAVFDLVYRRGGTAWVKRALANGIPALDGSEMLLQQAAAAFEIWWETDAPINKMRAAMEAPQE